MKITGIEKHPQRSNRGQGGVAHQLSELEKKIRPDLQPQVAKTSKTAANIPAGIPANKMAPQAPEKAVKSKRLAPAEVRVTFEPVSILTYFTQRSWSWCKRKTHHWGMALQSHHNTRSRLKVPGLASKQALHQQSNMHQQLCQSARTRQISGTPQHNLRKIPR